MAGITLSGFETKRFSDVIGDMQDRAKSIFQDLVAANDSVDVSDSSTIGRFIGWVSPQITELWEAAQDTYTIFDPNSSYGIGLDNLVAYGGLTREKASRTRFFAEVWADTDVVIDAGRIVKNKITGAQFSSSVTTTLDATRAAGFAVVPANAVVGSLYTLYLATSKVWLSWSYTAQAGDTQASILENLENYIIANGRNQFSTRFEDVTGLLYIDPIENVSSVSKSTSSNLVITKVKHLLQFEALDFGPVEAQVDAVTEIVTPVLGWDSVRNNTVATLGTFAESDEALRERFRLSKAIRAISLTDSLYAALLEVEGVEQVRLYENTQNSVDTLGQPPHSFRPVVLGGINQLVAEAIWKNRPLGIASTGNTSVTIKDSHDNLQVVSFTRPIETPIYVSISLTEIDEGLPEGGVESIKEAVAEYINKTRKIGGELVVSRLYTPANTVSGHEIDSILIGTNAGSLSPNKIVLNYDQIALVRMEDIQVTVA